MAEYIEREKIGLSDFEIVMCNGDYKEALKMLLEKIESIPAADVRPVVRGEWEKTEDFDEYGGGRYVEWTCSVCFSKAKGGWAVRDEHIDEPPDWNYCPHCGADMREEGKWWLN